MKFRFGYLSLLPVLHHKTQESFSAWCTFQTVIRFSRTSLNVMGGLLMKLSNDVETVWKIELTKMGQNYPLFLTLARVSEHDTTTHAWKWSVMYVWQHLQWDFHKLNNALCLKTCKYKKRWHRERVGRFSSERNCNALGSQMLDSILRFFACLCGS